MVHFLIPTITVVVNLLDFPQKTQYFPEDMAPEWQKQKKRDTQSPSPVLHSGFSVTSGVLHTQKD